MNILSLVSEVIEKHILNRFYEFINEANLIPSCQAEFWHGYNTSTCLVYLLNEIGSNQDKNLVAFLAIFDFGKTFVSISHNRMLVKCH